MGKRRGRYVANFSMGENGNVVYQEERALRISIEGAKTVTGVLYQRKFFRWKVIQVEQSRSGEETIEFELARPHPKFVSIPLPKGKYRVVVRAFIPSTTSYENGWDDEFEII